MPGALVIRRDAVDADPALAPGGRGARKLLVTDMRPATETLVEESEWRAADPCPIQVTGNVEFAVFNERAAQDCHVHHMATEIYVVMAGAMRIEVDGIEHALEAGDSIVVNAGAWHEVKPSEGLLCYVVSANSGGAADKFTS
jgi:mannose-6-phosphate isomerase-like protein (cupin superfamily)